jgi:hypothetical protein
LILVRIGHIANPSHTLLFAPNGMKKRTRLSGQEGTR